MLVASGGFAKSSKAEKHLLEAVRLSVGIRTVHFIAAEIRGGTRGGDVVSKIYKHQKEFTITTTNR